MTQPEAVPDSTSSSLLGRARKFDSEAWKTLVALYSPLVYQWCRRAGCQSNDAPDVVQDVFVSVHQHITGFQKKRQGDSFRGWLWTITRNKIRDLARRAENRPQIPGGSNFRQILENLPDEPIQGESDSRSTHIESQNNLLLEVLRQLCPNFGISTLTAFVAHAVNERPAPDVADELGVSEWTVRRAKGRVLKRLRESLGDIEDWHEVVRRIGDSKREKESGETENDDAS